MRPLMIFSDFNAGLEGIPEIGHVGDGQNTGKV